MPSKINDPFLYRRGDSHKIKLQELHDSKKRLSVATISLTNNSINLISDGDIAGVQLHFSGNAILERQLDYSWSIATGYDKVLIYTLTNQVLPENIFNYFGKINVSECLCVDWLGNQTKAYIDYDESRDEVINHMDSSFESYNEKFIQDMDNFSPNNFKYKKGISVIPPGTFNQYLKEKTDDQSGIAIDKAKIGYKATKEAKQNIMRVAKDMTTQKVKQVFSKTKQIKGGKY